MTAAATGDDAEHGGPQRGPAWERLGDQLEWYDGKSTHDRRWYQSLKVTQIVTAAAIPVVAAAGASTTVPAVLGGAVVVFEGVQQLFQFHQNWIRYRSTAQSLTRERSLYVELAGQYAGSDRPDAMLAERVEDIVSHESAAWAAGRQKRAERAQKE